MRQWMLAGLCIAACAASGWSVAADDNAGGAPAPVPIPEGSLEVTASGTLEWLRDDQMYVARGNAIARHDDVTVKGDTLVAHYTEPQDKKGSMQISSVTADGNVHLLSPTSEAFGDHGIYDLNGHLVTLTGSALKLVTTEEVVTARDSLQYNDQEAIGIATGNAVATHEDNKLTADVLTARFTKGPDKPPAASGSKTNGKAASKPAAKPVTADTQTASAANGDKPQGQHSLEELDAKGNVILVTPQDIVHGDSGIYHVQTDQTTVLGNVRVTRGDDQLDGARAEVDMQTGISRVFAAPNTRVRALLLPKKKDEASAADTAQPGSKAASE